MKNARTIRICYLCGEQLDPDPTKNDKDHVPPRQFYASTIRKQHQLNLFTLPVHAKCNKLYAKDEEYFLLTLVQNSS